MAVIIPTNGITTTMISQTIGEGSNDVGTLCSSSKINKWARYKPVRFNSVLPLPETTLSMLQYGLSPGQNTPSEYNFTTTSPYFVYLKPRGKGGMYNEPYRMSDFLNPGSTVDGTNKNLPGYNHNAECFIVDDTIEKRLTFSKIFELQSSASGGTHGGKLHMDRILNTSSNVEIAANFIYSSITWESYVGMFFYNITTGAKWYNAYKVKWSELASSSLSWSDFIPTNVVSSIVGYGREWPEHFYLTGDQMSINNGDVIHSYYCCVPLQFYNNLGQPDQWRTNSQSETYWEDLFNSEEVIYFMTPGLNTIQVVSPSETCGHGIINMNKFDFTNNSHLSLYNNLPATSLIENQLSITLERTV